MNNLSITWELMRILRSILPPKSKCLDVGTQNTLMPGKAGATPFCLNLGLQENTLGNMEMSSRLGSPLESWGGTEESPCSLLLLSSCLMAPNLIGMHS